MSLQSDNENATHLLEALKVTLKERRLGYQAIADSLNVSLPTIKRMLNKTSIPLDRLLAICRLADVAPAEVFARAEKMAPKHTFFTPAQDKLFHNNPAYLSYFSALFYQRLSPSEIAKANKLTKISTERYLSALDKVGLIERDSGTRFRFQVKAPLGFGPDSKVLRECHVAFLRETVTQVLSPEKTGSFALLKPLQLERAQFHELISEVRALVDKFSYRSENPQSESKTERLYWQLAIAAGPGKPRARRPHHQPQSLWRLRQREPTTSPF